MIAVDASGWRSRASVNRRPDLHHTDSFVVIEDYWPAASAAATVSIVAASATCRGRTCSIRTPPRHATPAATTSAYEPAQANWPSRPDLFETDRGDRLQRTAIQLIVGNQLHQGLGIRLARARLVLIVPVTRWRPQVVGQFYCTDYRALTTARKLKRPREVAAAYIFCSYGSIARLGAWNGADDLARPTRYPLVFRMASGVAA
jgi:hypothetical protein